MFNLSSIQFFLFFFFSLAVTGQILYWSWLWQLKEYRIDRMRAHFQDIGSKNTFLALIGFSSLRQIKIPKLTAKAILIIILSFLFLTGAGVIFSYFYYFTSNIVLDAPINFSSQYISADISFLFVFLFIGYLIAPASVFFFVGILNGISAIFKKRIIAKARAKVAQFPNLKVIGITGSYGKSTTKEILADILSKKYKVLRTPANINTAIGIAQLILDKLDGTHEIFVVEMGAYKIGEIKEICDMIKPKMGIITAINEQHLALFGKIENTIKAKFELVESLPEAGLAILNAGDANIQIGLKLWNLSAGEHKSEVKLYSVGAKADVYAIDEASDFQGIKFKLISGVDRKDFAINIAGAHNISNILAAIVAAQYLGMDLDKISQILQKIDYSDITIKNLIGPNGSILIDDTYNSNPDGVFAALHYLKNHRGRKIVIMPSLIELGFSAHKIHQRIGKEISVIAAKVFFLDNYYVTDFIRGEAENENSILEIITEKNIRKIAEQLSKDLKSGDTVLFINRGSRKVLELIKK